MNKSTLHTNSYSLKLYRCHLNVKRKKWLRALNSKHNEGGWCEETPRWCFLFNAKFQLKWIYRKKSCIEEFNHQKLLFDESFFYKNIKFRCRWKGCWLRRRSYLKITSSIAIFNALLKIYRLAQNTWNYLWYFPNENQWIILMTSKCYNSIEQILETFPNIHQSQNKTSSKRYSLSQHVPLIWLNKFSVFAFRSKISFHFSRSPIIIISRSRVLFRLFYFFSCFSSRFERKIL